jgi:hypothetical protein
MGESPQDLLRKLFGDEGPAEPTVPRNRKPLFRLSTALPEFAAETRRTLIECDEAELAKQVDELWIYDRCRCGGEECATVYTSTGEEPTSTSRRTGGHLPDAKGYVIIDVRNERIICIEMLEYPEFVSAVRELLP